ncbi:hypothetical protein QAD02_015953 [Eretmocerus hayati]|uniref:Uncharacterized protein n=1 Tax=Eretmocerus hayati TaxID=131215 RepID=A0ACC2P9P2_9HYME|nr:hypothetical protein QAD02_015953 [Eretmocerus hayati]
MDDSSSDTSSSSSSDSSSASAHPQSSSSSSDSISSGDLSDFFDDPSDNEEPVRKRRVCIKNYVDETVQQYSDKKFLRTFRLPREKVNLLIERFSESEFFNREDGWMLGDPAYPCSKYLVTAYKDNGHLLPYQKEFNKAVSECRVDVEHTIGILKQRMKTFSIQYHHTSYMWTLNNNTY